MLIARFGLGGLTVLHLQLSWLVLAGGWRGLLRVIVMGILASSPIALAAKAVPSLLLQPVEVVVVLETFSVE